jgi:hypothetical protein
MSATPQMSVFQNPARAVNIDALVKIKQPVIANAVKQSLPLHVLETPGLPRQPLRFFPAMTDKMSFGTSSSLHVQTRSPSAEVSCPQ